MTIDQRPHVAALFDRTADDYDHVGVDLFQPIAERLVTELRPQPGERALDIGCGRGAVLFRLAAAVAPGGTATGIDLAPRMVELARGEGEAAGLGLDVHVGDAQEPALPAGSYDVIASSLVIFFLPDPTAALHAWRELLVPGGRLGVSTFGPYNPEWKPVDEVFAPFLPPALADPRTQGSESPFASDAGMERLFARAGLTGVRTAATTVAVRFDDADHWHRWTWSVGQRRMWELVPEDQREAVRATAYERLEHCRHADGRMGFDQVARFTVGTRG